MARALAVAQERGWASAEEARPLWWKVVGEVEVAADLKASRPKMSTGPY